MRIAYASDLHLEFGRDLAALVARPLSADVLILAGDIDVDPGVLAWQILRARPLISADILVVLGNHEYYNHTFPSVSDRYRQALHRIPRTHLLNDDEVMIGGVRFLGTTLWSDFAGGRHSDACQREMADFHIIQGVDGQPLITDEIVAAHNVSWDWLTQRLSKPHQGPTVVVSHHAPSFQSNHPRYAHSPISGGFCSDKNAAIQRLPYPPDAWIHGHLHDPADYWIGKTHVLSHPWGYPDEQRPCDFGFLALSRAGESVWSRQDPKKRRLKATETL